MKRLIIAFIALLLPLTATHAQKKDTYQVRTVVIDPGHGGAKPGARGGRSFEKDITLSVAKKFGKLISDNYPDIKIIYTRTTDADISLAERARIANSSKADLFISIHANSHPTASPSGVETFVMGLSESRANLEVAKKENADILLEVDYKTNADYSGFDPNAPETYVMLTMFQNAFIDKSLNFAQAIQNQYKQQLKTINRGVKQAELYVLYKTTCPSVLTEIGFISNPTEEAYMLSDEGQAKIAVSLFNAFMNYKATEEGVGKIANPIIDLPGYSTTTPPAIATSTTTPKQAKDTIKQAEVAISSPTDTPIELTDKESPVLVEKVETPATPTDTTSPVSPITPPQKPTPSPTLPPVKETTTTESSSIVAATNSATPTAPLSEPSPTPLPAPKPQREALVPPTNTANASANQYYTVQFLALNIERKPGAPELEGITDFQTVRQGNTYIYLTGRFRTQQEAAAYCEHLHRATSFSDAWAYLYKVPANAQPTATPSQSSHQQSVSTAISGLTYRVQFCTSNKLMTAGDPDLQGINDFQTSPSGRYHIYTAGNYSTLNEAQQRCASIQRSTRFKDAYVVAFHNGSRISLEQAKALTQKR